MFLFIYPINKTYNINGHSVREFFYSLFDASELYIYIYILCRNLLLINNLHLNDLH